MIEATWELLKISALMLGIVIIWAIIYIVIKTVIDEVTNL